MPSPVKSPYLVPFNGQFSVADAPTKPPQDVASDKKLGKQLKHLTRKIAELQRALYADDRYALLLIFQAMDAAGKDGTIRAVTTGVNPAGFQVFAFKQPSDEELDHDFLWRTAKRLPERGRIGIFNRSYYEETLVVRVHPEYLGSQKLPKLPKQLDDLWEHRFESIRGHEQHLNANGIKVVKFWLNVSHEEQHARFVARIDNPDKSWKFSAGDVAESKLWDKYMQAYEATLNATSRKWAPWYAIPADSKPYMRVCVADIVYRTLKSLPLHYPQPSDKDVKLMQKLRDELTKK